MQATAITLGRALLGLYFFIPGLTKITGYAATLDYMVLHNIPLPDILLPLTIAIQVGGGLALMAGFRIREMALCLAGLTILILSLIHI